MFRHRISYGSRNGSLIYCAWLWCRDVYEMGEPRKATEPAQIEPEKAEKIPA